MVCSNSSREEDFSINSECEDSREWSFPCSCSTEDLERDGGRDGGREGGREGGTEGGREGKMVLLAMYMYHNNSYTTL